MRALEFLQDLVEKFNPGKDTDHFGLNTFRTDVNLVFNFADSKYYNKDALMKKIGDEPTTVDTGVGRTRTDLALTLAKEQLFTDADDRPSKPNVMIVLTDGKPNPMYEFEKIEKDIRKFFQVSDYYT